MAITTQDGIVGAARQRIGLTKTASRTSVAATPFSVFDLAGQPGAGTLAGSSTTAGVVPTDATTGCLNIDTFGGGSTGYLDQVLFSNSVAGRVDIYDMLFKAGAYAFNAAQTLSAQPSFTSRIPTNDVQTEIWIETVTAFTGNLSVAVTYTNDASTTGRTTGTIATGVAPTVGRMFRLPLQAGDRGVRVIESVTATVATVGTFNVLVLRHIASLDIRVANAQVTQNWIDTGRPQVYDTSALIMVVTADSTSTGTPSIRGLITNG